MAVMAFRLVVVALYLSCVVLATLAHEDRSNFTSPFGRRLPNSPHLSALHERSALPSESNFYTLPHSLNQVPNGHVFRSRTLPYATHRRFGGDLVGKIEQLQYKYTMTGGIDDATVVTVLSPSRPAKGETKIVVIGLAEDSAARDCAPSYAFSHYGTSRVSSSIFPNLMISSALNRGWYVIAADIEGSKSAWLTLETEGHATLSAVRAFVKYKNLNFDDFKIALTGFSGGSHSTGAAYELATHYSDLLPHIKIWAAAELPVDLVKLFRLRQGHKMAGLFLSGMAGIANGHPKMRAYLDGILTSKGRALFRKIRSGKYCGYNSLVPHFEGYSLKSFTKHGQDPLDSPVVIKAIQNEKLGRKSSASPIPAFLVHSKADDVSPFHIARSFVISECKKGANIRFRTPLAGDHIQMYFRSHPYFVKAIQRAFEGHTPSGCSFRDSLAGDEEDELGEEEIEELLGAQAYQVYLDNV